ncbi:ABC transporter permease [Aurantimonas sp. C2-6-R+9]|uniref:ABC transporter permease n=1 Tax=unclassified Aurantimonas TaxID=2638230 RepID=UPI002E1743E3|nr:ABC transporter permease [Aurantimonas sp. C2-6-R+9]
MNRVLSSSGPAALGAAGAAIFFLAWEGIARLELVNPAFLPAPSAVAIAAYRLIVSGELLVHLTASIWRAVLGFFFGSVTGITVGIATARLPIFRHMSDPLLQMFRAIPSIAFVPLAIFWFGIGEVSKIFLIAWGVFFPVWVNTFLGVRDVNPLLMRAAATLGAGGFRMLWNVILPSALPLILAGLRISLAVALVLLVAAELAGATAGVGYFIQLSAQVFRVDQMFVGLLTLGVLGFCADLLFVNVVKFLFPWYGAEGRAARR